MPQNITHDSTLFSPTLSVPSDGIDPVNEQSVNPVFQKLLNNDYYMASSLIRDLPRLSVFSSNGTTVRINAFFGLWVASANVAFNLANWVIINNSAVSSVTSANLDTGMSFIPSTPYYLYARTNGSGVALFECSLVAPDAQLTFKNVMGTPDLSRRYVGSFLIKGDGTILPFIMNNFDYEVQDGINTFDPSPGVTGAVTTNYAVTFSNFPPTMSRVKCTLNMSCSGTTLADATTVQFRPLGSFDASKSYYLAPIVALGNVFPFQATLPTSGNFIYVTTIGSSASANGYPIIIVNGYVES